MNHTDDRRELPAVSLVVCTRNRSNALAKALEQLARVEAPTGGWELVVVDNGSTDETGAVLRAFAASASIPVTIVSEPRRGLGRARCSGVAHTRSSIVVFTDDDCYPAPDFLQKVLEAFREEHLGFVGGRVLLFDPTDARVTIRETERPEYFSPGGWIAAGQIHGANMALRRRVIDEVGGFDPMLGAGTPFPIEDVDILARALAAGWAGAYRPELVVWHHHGRKPGDALHKLLRYYDYGRGAYFAKLMLSRRTWSHFIRLTYWSLRDAVIRKEYGRMARELWGMFRYWLARSAVIVFGSAAAADTPALSSHTWNTH
jgi:glycosyltransferase involved in cell wall biosynthesis